MSQIKAHVRLEVGKILAGYSLKRMLDGIDDAALEAMFRVYILPLNIKTLAEAKVHVLAKTGYTPEMVGITASHQQQIWDLCQQYIEQLK